VRELDDTSTANALGSAEVEVLRTEEEDVVRRQNGGEKEPRT
jgi:hypothetical protein